MKKLLALLLVPTLIIAGGYYGPGGSSSSAGAGTGNILSINGDTNAAHSLVTGTAGSDFAISTNAGTHTFDLPDAGASARGVVTTGSQTLAGQKTLSSAPILSSLTAQAMPYLNASKVMSNGGWTQADTTFATVFTPTGSPTNGLSIPLGSMTSFTNGLSLSGALPAAADVTAIRVNNSLSGTDRFSYSQKNTLSGTATTSTPINFFGENAVSNTGNSLGSRNVQPKGNFAFYGQVENPGASGGAFGVNVYAAQGKTNVGGLFHAVAAQSVADNKTIGVHAVATGENSARANAVYGKIATATSAGVEGSVPDVASAALFDNGDTTSNILTLEDNGSSVFQVQDGGNVIVNRSMIGGSLFPTKLVEKVVYLADGASLQLDPTLGNIFAVTSTQAAVSVNPVVGCADGQKLTIRFKASGGNRTLNFSTGTAGAWRFGEDITATSVTTSGKTDYFTGFCNGPDNRVDLVANTKGY